MSNGSYMIINHRPRREYFANLIEIYHNVSNIYLLAPRSTFATVKLKNCPRLRKNANLLRKSPANVKDMEQNAKQPLNPEVWKKQLN